MFATYQNAWCAVFNTRDPMRIEEVGYYVPSGDIETGWIPDPTAPVWRTRPTSSSTPRASSM